MSDNTRKIFSLPLINKWYVILTLIFILMRVTHIISWSPLWILAPLWIPWTIAGITIVIPYVLLFIITIIDFIYQKIHYKKL